MKVKFWGVRGSLATPLEPKDVEKKIRLSIEKYIASHGADLGHLDSFLETQGPRLAGYGGHTSCIQITSDSDSLIIDGGSGMKLLGDELLKGEFGAGRGRLKILMTHFHWDHLVGLPFFTPFYIPGNVFDIYCPDPYVEEAFKTVFKKPFFPLPWDQLGATLSFHKVPERKAFQLGDFSVAAYRLDHPDPCWGYKITSKNKTLSYAVDTEAHRQTPQELGEDLPLYQNSDLLVFDAQYTMEELTKKKNWGHSSAPIGLRLALEHKVSRVLFVHHDPSSSDEDIEVAKVEAQRAFEELIKLYPESRLVWDFAHESEEVEL